ncbi:hypothetical protein BDV93DRAFT_403222, partial [Ceratobasidium sp. AG-I]
NVTERQVRDIAHSARYHRRVARRKPYTHTLHALKRLKWARKNRLTDWDDLAWTDETRIEAGELPTHLRVTRKPGEEYLPECVVPTFQHGRFGITVSGCISHGYKGPIKLLELEPYQVAPSGRRKGGG